MASGIPNPNREQREMRALVSFENGMLARALKTRRSIPAISHLSTLFPPQYGRKAQLPSVFLSHGTGCVPSECRARSLPIVPSKRGRQRSYPPFSGFDGGSHLPLPPAHEEGSQGNPGSNPAASEKSEVKVVTPRETLVFDLSCGVRAGRAISSKTDRRGWRREGQEEGRGREGEKGSEINRSVYPFYCGRRLEPPSRRIRSSAVSDSRCKCARGSRRLRA